MGSALGLGVALGSGTPWTSGSQSGEAKEEESLWRAQGVTEGMSHRQEARVRLLSHKTPHAWASDFCSGKQCYLMDVRKVST